MAETNTNNPARAAEEKAKAEEIAKAKAAEEAKKKAELEEKKKAEEKAKAEAEAKAKAASFKFNEKDYKEMEKYEETLPVRQLNERGQVVVIDTPTGRFLEREVITKAFIKKYGFGNEHNAKCQYRAALFFDVTVDHLAKAYSLLNGKKIDGFFVNDLIDRFGWSDGKQMSRDMLRKAYKKNNINTVNVAQKKVKDVVNSADITKSYVDLVKDVKEEFSNNLRDKAVYGE